MVRIIIALSLFCAVFLCSIVYAQNDKPNVPYIQKNVCPFECCQYGKWIAKSQLKAYKRESDSSTIAFTIKPGEQFTAIKGNVHIIKLGVVVITESFDVFSKGDNVFVLSYKGEGFYDVWYKGKVLKNIEQFWPDELSKLTGKGRLKQLQKMIWWVLVKNEAGRQGWLMLKNISNNGFLLNEKIDGIDACE
ncbi:MAG: hypothetical protein HZA11_08055 [Nitrospirae bacterium]|nr:hypothetical protein [Nitrospirota bacterium]